MNVLRRRRVPSIESSDNAQSGVHRISDGIDDASSSKNEIVENIKIHPQKEKDKQVKEEGKKKRKKRRSSSQPPAPLPNSSDDEGEVVNPAHGAPTSLTLAAKTKPDPPEQKFQRKGRKPKRNRWSCVDTCCWLIGYICCLWWLLLVLYKALPSLSEAISGPLPDPPGVVLKNSGLKARHPIVFVPGIVTGGLELWEGQPCAEGLFRKRLWGGTFGEVYKRPFCWMEHMSLDNVTGMDPPGVRVRPVSGLVAADYFMAGYFVWAVLIENLAKIGYEEKNLHMAAYDWRLSFQNTEVRDKTLSRLKSNIELLVRTNNGQKVVAVPHSMGTLYFLHFMKWVEAPAPMGGGGGPDWCAKHIKAVMNIAGPLLGVPKAVSGLFSAEAKDIAVARAIAPGVLDSESFGLQTLQHIMRVTRTWDSTMSMIPKGGEVIWGGVDWSPEEGYCCASDKNNSEKVQAISDNQNSILKDVGPHRKPMAHYGRLISFGKNVSELVSSRIIRKPFMNVRGHNPVNANLSCGDAWTEYHEMSWEGIRAVAEHNVFTSGDILDVLRYVAPAMMQRGDAQFSHGLADDLDDPKYEHFKYWSNPLESRLPHAPDMEIYCMYGVGILTERSYVYKMAPQSDYCHIPFRIDTRAEGDSEGCLKGGVHFVDGDETVPVLSSGFMCAKGWRGKTRFNPSGAATFVREYNHAPPANLLEGRGTQSGAHVDIMGNFRLIEDILRVAAGESGEDLGGDQIHSKIMEWAARVPLKL
ncbi:hypothetical protein KP509_22G014900 [Ceratopteris richardii]|uniref:phospholipid:diacylglycerol acyltransferase n=1 Tax=Ceratopteris richardii TaxID=49495 RepID=A0A8T2S3S7_CERRI|nr:hypothetical protein KP509_22G014900 [Ceratopteris richardii]